MKKKDENNDELEGGKPQPCRITLNRWRTLFSQKKPKGGKTPATEGGGASTHAEHKMSTIDGKGGIDLLPADHFAESQKHPQDCSDYITTNHTSVLENRLGPGRRQKAFSPEADWLDIWGKVFSFLMEFV